MPTILTTDDFIVKAPDRPHHSRENGGHIVIMPKVRYAHRYEMPLNIASKMMHLSQVLGEAFTKVMRSNGIDIVRINYQDNGNWAYKEPVYPPHLHWHLYGRTLHEKHPRNDPRFQAFPDALVFPDESTDFYEGFRPLTEQDCQDILSVFQDLLTSKKYEGLKNQFWLNKSVLDF